MVMFDISQNEIADLDRINGVDSLTKIDAINLAGNKITKIDQLQNLKTLRWLNLSGNDIQSIEPLGALENLEYLLIADNLICKIPESVLALTNEHLNHHGKWIKLQISGQDDQRDCSYAY
jgi:Leucine-rich repeat (LRR) protein